MAHPMFVPGFIFAVYQTWSGANTSDALDFRTLNCRQTKFLVFSITARMLPRPTLQAIFIHLRGRGAHFRPELTEKRCGSITLLLLLLLLLFIIIILNFTAMQHGR